MASLKKCPDCELPRRDGDEEHGSGLKDHNTLCATCAGGGMVDVDTGKAPEPVETEAESTEEEEAPAKPKGKTKRKTTRRRKK